MKRIVLALAVAILLFTTLTALGEGRPAAIRLGGTGDDHLTTAVPLENGNLLLAMSSQGGRNGQAEHPQGARKMWLLCLAPNGSPLWETEYGHEKGSSWFYGLTVDGGSVTGALRHSIDDSMQYTQRRTYSLADGALLWEGEKADPSKLDRNVKIYEYPLGPLLFEQEVHDYEATCEPRFYRLRDAGGGELWCVDAKEVGLSNQEGQLRFGESTLLWGRQWNYESGSSQLVALRIDDGGNLLWRASLTDIEDGLFRDGLLDSRGRMVLTGISRSAMRVSSEGYGLGYEDQKQLLVCMDAATGEQLWRHENGLVSDEVLPIDDILQVEAGYLLAGVGLNHMGSAFELLDFDGNSLARWSTVLPETVSYGQTLFHWKGETWVGTSIEEDGTRDVYLERVEMPMSGAPRT